MNYSNRTNEHTEHNYLRYVILFIAIAAIIIIASLVVSALKNTLTDDNPDATPLRQEYNSVIDDTYIPYHTGDISSLDLILVNNRNAYDFKPELDLVSIYEHKSSNYYVRDSEVLLSADVIPFLNEMLDDFYAETGLKSINVTSGHRTYDYQQMLYNDSVSLYGEEYTSKYLALPGSSEHHTGLAVDFSIYYEDTGLSDDFDGTGEYAWINENSWRYGFIQRYQIGKEELTMIYNEPWHFRYVGVPHAKVMTEKDFCFEEYLDYLKSFTVDGEHLSVEHDGQAYEIYYCPDDSILVPANEEYSVSTTNTGGCIVTVSK